MDAHRTGGPGPGSRRIRTVARPGPEARGCPHGVSHQPGDLTDPTARQSQSQRAPRSALHSLRRRLVTRRRSTARLPGRVGCRSGSTCSAAQSRSSISSRARRRLRAWERLLSTATRKTEPSRATNRSRASSSMPSTADRSSEASARVLLRLACWPPGPPEGLKPQATSPADTRHPGPAKRSRSTSRGTDRGCCRSPNGQGTGSIACHQSGLLNSAGWPPTTVRGVVKLVCN